jgi:hypothetical protein
MLLFLDYYSTNGPDLYRNCGSQREYKMVDKDNIKSDYPQGKILQLNLIIYSNIYVSMEVCT